MIKRKETMPDGRRYIVYFTFDKAGSEEQRTETRQIPTKSQEMVEGKGFVSQCSSLKPEPSEVGSDV
jgi:hypothetical protein